MNLCARPQSTSSAPLELISGGRSKQAKLLVIDTTFELLSSKEAAALANLKKAGIDCLEFNPLPLELASERLASLCKAHGASFLETIYLATTPASFPVCLEARWLFALEDAGENITAASDARFPARSKDGLMRALNSISHWLNTSQQATVTR